MRKLEASQAGADSCGIRFAMPGERRSADTQRQLKKRCVVVMTLALLVLFAMPVFAQDQSTPGQEQPPTQEGAPQPEEKPTPSAAHKKAPKRPDVTTKFDFSAGFSHRTYYAPATGLEGAPGNLGMSGFYATLDYNRYRYLAYEGEISATRGNAGGFEGINGETHIYSMMVGARVNPLRHRKFTPFVHGLIGNGLYENVVPSLPAPFHGGTLLKDKMSYEGGAGLDLNLWEHWGIRVIEWDYSSANYYSNTMNYTNSMSRRISFGFVYRFGRRK